MARPSGNVSDCNTVPIEKGTEIGKLLSSEAFAMTAANGTEPVTSCPCSTGVRSV